MDDILRMDRKEVRGLIKYLIKKRMLSFEIKEEIKHTLGRRAPSSACIKKWVTFFKNRMEIEARNLRRSAQSYKRYQNKVDRILEMILMDASVGSRHIGSVVGMSEVSVNNILANVLQMKRMTSRWVPDELSAEQALMRVIVAKKHMELYRKSSNDFLDNFITVDHTWINYTITYEVCKEAVCGSENTLCVKQYIMDPNQQESVLTLLSCALRKMDQMNHKTYHFNCGSEQIECKIGYNKRGGSESEQRECETEKKLYETGRRAYYRETASGLKQEAGQNVSSLLSCALRNIDQIKLQPQQINSEHEQMEYGSGPGRTKRNIDQEDWAVRQKVPSLLNCALRKIEQMKFNSAQRSETENMDWEPLRSEYDSELIDVVEYISNRRSEQNNESHSEPEQSTSESEESGGTDDEQEESDSGSEESETEVETTDVTSQDEKRKKKTQQQAERDTTPESEYEYDEARPVRRAEIPKPTEKILLTVFWDAKGVLLTDYQHEAMTRETYTNLLDVLAEKIREKRPEKMGKQIIFQQTNTRPQNSPMVMAKMYELGFEPLDHPPHSPDLSPSDYFLFPSLRAVLESKHLLSREHVIESTQDYLYNELQAGACKKAIFSLYKRWLLCVRNKGDYVSGYVK